MFCIDLSRMLTSPRYAYYSIHRRRLGTASWKDKLFVNYLKLPKYMRIHGPTGEEVTRDIDLTDKTCLITGGTNGIGSEITRCLIARNCNVLMACRNPYVANIAAKNVWGDPSKLTVYKTNLTSLASVKKSSDQILKDQTKIDIIILNAGVFGIPWTQTEDGLETIFQVNYLSQYFLLMNLEKILAPNVRVVFLSSESHRNLRWSLRETVSPAEENLSLPYEKYSSIKAYNVSKVCGILAMHYLAHRWLNRGRSVFCAHPGSFVKTNLCTNWWVYEALYIALSPFSKSIQQAASTPLYCATSPKLQGFSDLYIKDCKETTEGELAQNIHLAYRIMDLTHSMIKERVDLLDEDEKAKDVEYEETAQLVKPESAKTEPGQEAHVLSA